MRLLIAHGHVETGETVSQATLRRGSASCACQTARAALHTGHISRARQRTDFFQMCDKLMAKLRWWRSCPPGLCCAASCACPPAWAALHTGHISQAREHLHRYRYRWELKFKLKPK